MGNLDIELIYLFQNIGDRFIPLMSFFTSLGDGEFYLIVIAAIYWSWNKKHAIKLGIAVFFGSLMNTILKISIRSPRPYWVDSNVVAGSVEHSFGMPSGHAQGSMSFWGMWGILNKKSWFWLISIIFIFFTGLSRSFLGVHFPSQIVVGWVLGFFILLLINRLESPFMNWFKTKRISFQFVIVFITSIFGLCLILIIRLSQADWQVPEEWISRAVIAHEDHSLITPLSLLSPIRDSAILFGFLSGFLILDKYFKFNAGGNVWKRVFRFLVGIALTLTLWYGLGNVVKMFDNLVLSYVLQYSRSFMLGFFITFIWPWLCLKIKLTE
ncbi:MAG: phosphatase PAP2 family protein [Spirochaetaceae bacterium]